TVAVRIEVVEQIALPRRRGRRRHQPRVAPAEAEPLKTAEAEDLVAKNRKARRRAILVLAIRRFLRPVEEVARVEHVVAEVFIDRAVQFARPGFESDGDLTARLVSALDIVERRPDAKLLDHIHGRQYRERVEEPIERAYPVHGVVIVRLSRAVDREVGVVEPADQVTAQRPARRRADARRESDQLGELSAVEREINDA